MFGHVTLRCQKHFSFSCSKHAVQRGQANEEEDATRVSRPAVNRYTTGEVPGSLSWYSDAEPIPFTRVRAGANHVDMEFTPDAILKHFA